jgi:phosphoglycerate dehydrogenase-like enzyme
MSTKIISMAPLNPDLLMSLLKGAGRSIPADIEIISANKLSDEEIIELVGDAAIIIGDYTFNRKITRDIAMAARSVKLIQQPSVGYQHIDIEACAEAGIPVANTAGANTISVAEYTVMAGLCMQKKLMMAHRTTAAGEWRQIDVGSGDLFGKLWGLVGMGRIGKAVAERLVPFGVQIKYYDIVKLSPDEEKKHRASFCKIEEMVATSDLISLHCPLTSLTKGIIGEKELSRMKATAVIINVARGEVIDEPALVRALKEKRIAGAVLDVFSEEPLGTKNPLLSLGPDVVILTPHIAGATREAQFRIMSMAVSNVISVLNGDKPDFLVN